MTRLVRKFSTRNGKAGHREMCSGDDENEVPKGRLPRITKLMALAIRFQKLIDDGVVKDQAEIARLGHVTRARVTQIMNLLFLAPEIQEEILFMPRVERGKDPVHLKKMLPVSGELSWERQFTKWHEIFVVNANRS